jgi:hypothetical protein
MNRSIVFLASLPALLAACGGSFPPPTQRMADAQSAERSARELGADAEPRAQLSLKLAQDQITAAQKAITDGDNQRADSLLIRAKADAELAVSDRISAQGFGPTRSVGDNASPEGRANNRRVEIVVQPPSAS